MKTKISMIIMIVISVIAIVSCDDPESSGDYLTGNVSRDEWKAKVGFAGYDGYNPDSSAVAQIAAITKNHPNLRFRLYASSWCGTCVKAVPLIFKCFDAISYPDSLLTFVAIDHNRRDPLGLAAKDNILNTLTLIVRNDDTEIDRISEVYNTTWIAEILRMTQKIK